MQKCNIKQRPFCDYDGSKQKQDHSTITSEHRQSMNIFQIINNDQHPILANMSNCCSLTDNRVSILLVFFPSGYDLLKCPVIKLPLLLTAPNLLKCFPNYLTQSKSYKTFLTLASWEAPLFLMVYISFSLHPVINKIWSTTNVFLVVFG